MPHSRRRMKSSKPLTWCSLPEGAALRHYLAWGHVRRRLPLPEGAALRHYRHCAGNCDRSCGGGAGRKGRDEERERARHSHHCGPGSALLAAAARARPFALSRSRSRSCARARALSLTPSLPPYYSYSMKSRHPGRLRLPRERHSSLFLTICFRNPL